MGARSIERIWCRSAIETDSHRRIHRRLYGGSIRPPQIIRGGSRPSRLYRERWCRLPTKSAEGMPPHAAHGRLRWITRHLDIDSGLDTLPDERAARYSAQTQEVINSTRFDSDEFHQYTSRLVSAAQYEPAGRAWLVSSFCAMRQARRRSTKKGRRTRVFVGPGVKSEHGSGCDACLDRRELHFSLARSSPTSDDPRHRIGWFDASTSWVWAAPSCCGEARASCATILLLLLQVDCGRATGGYPHPAPAHHLPLPRSPHPAGPPPM